MTALEHRTSNIERTTSNEQETVAGPHFGVRSSMLDVRCFPGLLREWEPNPIFLKELRQAMRNRMFTGIVLFLLAALPLSAIGLFGAQDLASSGSWFVGQKLFNAFLAVLASVSIVFVPLYTGVRFAVERQHLDLMLFTLISEKKVVRGKLASGLYLALLCFSVCMPFMTFTNLFEGVDFPTILFVLAVLFAAAFLGILAAIALASAPVHTGGKIFLGAAFAVGLAAACWFITVFLIGVVDTGIETRFQSRDFRGGFFVAIFFAVPAAVWFYVISVSSIAVLRHPTLYFDKRKARLETAYE